MNEATDSVYIHEQLMTVGAMNNGATDGERTTEENT